MHLFLKFILGMKLYVFRTVFELSRRIRMEFCSILILLESCLQSYMTYTIAVCTVKNSWWWAEELSETCRVSFQNKFEKLVHLVRFIVRNLSRCTVTWASKSHTNKKHILKVSIQCNFFFFLFLDIMYSAYCADQMHCIRINEIKYK